MSQHEIQLSQTSEHSLDELFAILSDHNQLGALMGAPVKRIQDGQTDINGVGSVRRIGPPLIGLEETVTAYEPNKFIEYRISRNGGPVKNHAGRLDFSATENGSSVSWSVRFEAPAAFIGRTIASMLGKSLAKGLQRIA